MEKPIKDFEDYTITSDGTIISYKYKQPRILKTYISNGYENVTLMKNGLKYHKLVHRLVAEHFLEKPNENFNEVHHKDNNPLNNNVDNLEWCTRAMNIGYTKIQFRRNTCPCYLIKVDTNEIISKFDTISEAAKWAQENLGCSKTYLQRKEGNVSNGYSIIKIRCRD